jgi:hypothetical protein
VANALQDARSERTAAEGALRQVALARAEAERRKVEARQERERRAKAKALAEAKVLNAPLAATARKFDKAADQLARLAQEDRSTAEERQRLLHAAGVAEHPWPGNGVSIYAAAIIEAWDANGGIAAWAQWPGGKPGRLADATDGFTEEVPTT